MPRHHTLAEFVPASLFGEGGSRFRTTIEQYEFDQVHPVAKHQMPVPVDMFAYGLESAGLLLWWGDLTAARRGVRRVLDTHKRMLTRVQQGEAPAEAYATK